MPDLLRPEPPRSLLERASALRATLHPARLATGAGIVLLLVGAAWWLVRAPSPPVEDQLPRASTTPATFTVTATAADAPTGASADVVVQVAGAVARPGVYRLRSGARVMDLVDAAGGPAADADLESMSLAAHLVDGQRVQVPRQGEVLPSSVTGGAAPVQPTGDAGADGVVGGTSPIEPVDLNAATVEQLDALPGVGPATAQAIVVYRARHGAFQSVDDLTDVPGIGPAKLDALRDLVRV